MVSGPLHVSVPSLPRCRSLQLQTLIKSFYQKTGFACQEFALVSSMRCVNIAPLEVIVMK